jgi:hypothetical protein
MGFFRSGLLFVLGILLLVSLIGLNSLFIVSSSLEYENVEEALIEFVNGGALEDTVGSMGFESNIGLEINLDEVEDEIFNLAKEYCANNEDYVFSEEGYTIEIPCEVVSEGKDSFINNAIENIVYEIYYDDYDCGFWDCLSEEGKGLVLISEKAKDYWKGKLYWAFLISLILAILIFLVVEQKQNFPIVLGLVVLISALPFMKADSFISFFAGDFSGLLLSFIENIRNVFWFSVVIGLFFIATGIVWRFWRPDLLKKKFSKKDIKKIVKKENQNVGK